MAFCPSSLGTWNRLALLKANTRKGRGDVISSKGTADVHEVRRACGKVGQQKHDWHGHLCAFLQEHSLPEDGFKVRMLVEGLAHEGHTLAFGVGVAGRQPPWCQKQTTNARVSM